MGPITRVVCDGTGRSREELGVRAAGAVLVTAAVGVLRVVDVVTEARSGRHRKPATGQAGQAGQSSG